MKCPVLLVTVLAASTLTPAAASASLSAQAQEFAQCAIKQYEGAELLATQPGTTEEADVIAEFERRGCSSASQTAVSLRGALAEQLFKADFGSIGAHPRREEIEVFRIDATELDGLDATTRRRLDLVAFATCVAASAPEKSDAALKTAPGSAEEVAAFAALQPTFAPCLAEGERLDMGKAELRGAVAEGAYRLALAQTLDEEIVVTGTRDPARKIVCRSQETAGTRMRRQTCLTEAQWFIRDRHNEYHAEDFTWRVMTEEERGTAIGMAKSRQGGN